MRSSDARDLSTAAGYISSVSTILNLFLFLRTKFYIISLSKPSSDRANVGLRETSIQPLEKGGGCHLAIFLQVVSACSRKSFLFYIAFFS